MSSLVCSATTMLVLRTINNILGVLHGNMIVNHFTLRAEKVWGEAIWTIPSSSGEEAYQLKVKFDFTISIYLNLDQDWDVKPPGLNEILSIEFKLYYPHSNSKSYIAEVCPETKNFRIRRNKDDEKVWLVGNSGNNRWTEPVAKHGLEGLEFMI
jgi:hypothetical protein